VQGSRIDGLYNSIIGINENKYLTAKEVENRLTDPVLAPQFKLSMQMFPINEQESQYLCYYPRRGYNESNHFYIANGEKRYDKVGGGTEGDLLLEVL